MILPRIFVVLLLMLLFSPIEAEAQRSQNAQIAADKIVNAAECNSLRSSPNAPGYADDLISAGGMICPCAPKPGLFIERIVYCFADAPNGLIYGIIQDLIQATLPYYWAFYGPVILFATVLFGLKLTTGSLRSIQKDTFLFATKMGGVVSFLVLFPDLHAIFLKMVQALAEIPSEALSGFSDVCNLGSATQKPNLWAQWDCVLGKLTGVSVSDPNNNFVGSGLFMGIIGYIMPFIWMPGIGTMIVLVGLQVLLTLILSCMRMVNTYLLAVLAVSFLFLLGPLIVPLVLFGATYDRFSGWIKMLIGYALQPMLLILFMGVSLVAMNYAIFIGPSSLFGTISNTNPANAEFFGKVMWDSGNGIDITRNVGPELKFQGDIIVNPEVMPAKPGFSESLKYGDKKGDLGLFEGVPVNPAATPNGRDVIESGVEVTAASAKGYASDLSKRKDAVDKNLDEETWLERVFMQFTSTSMMVYVLYTLMGNVPGTVQGLLGGTANLAGAKMLGEDQLKRGLTIAKGLLKAYTTGGASGAADVLNKAFNNMAGKR